MREEIAKSFNICGHRAHLAFPERLKNFVLLTNTSDAPLYVSPDIAEHLRDNVEEVKDTVSRIRKTLLDKNAAGLAYRSYVMGGEGVALIALRDNPLGVFTDKYTQEMRAHYVLEHEIGHRVVEKGFAGGHLGECAADAYAVLRHVQDFGQDTDMFTHVAKAYVIVLGASPIHYTQAVFDAVKDYAAEHDVSKLSLQETAVLANDIAIDNRLSSTVLQKIEQAFSPAHQMFRERIGDKAAVTTAFYTEDPDAYALFCTETFFAVQRHLNDADIVKAGKEFLSFPSMKKFIQNAASQYPSWQVIADFIQTETTEDKQNQTVRTAPKNRAQRFGG